MEVEFMMESRLSGRRRVGAACVVKAAVIREPRNPVRGVPCVRDWIYVAGNDVRQRFFAVDVHYVERHARASGKGQPICDQRAVLRGVRVRQRDSAVVTQLTWIKQQPRCAVQCVLAIKRREFLVRETLAKEVSVSSFGDVPDGLPAQQLLQPPVNT